MRGHGAGNPNVGPAGASLIKSYDTAGMQQQRAQANLSIGGSGMGGGNFNSGGQVGRETGNNSALAVTREGSLNRGRGGGV